MKLPPIPRGIVKPRQDVTQAQASSFVLSAALQHVALEVREPGTDIQLGTTFYTPVVTLLARTLQTRRQDVVFCAWPLLGCPYYYFEDALPVLYVSDKVKQARVPFKEMLDTHMLAHDGRPPVLWEVFDLLQAQCGWRMRQLVEWVRAVEDCVYGSRPGLLMQLQTMADGARKMHDDSGMLEKEVGLAEGIVIPADGSGRVN